MAQDVTISIWCDWCDLLGLDRVPAHHQHVLALDGPPRRVDLCDRCHMELSSLHALYTERGQEIEAPRGGKKKAVGRSAARPRPEAGEGAGAAQPELPAITITGPVLEPGIDPEPQGTYADAPVIQPRTPQRKRGGRTRDPNKPSLVCPLAHPGSETGPMRISYEGRNSHADMVHGLRFSQIRWHDPDGILTVPCTVHQECLDHSVMFTTEVGARSHRASSNLPRLDGDAAGAGSGAGNGAGGGSGNGAGSGAGRGDGDEAA